MNLLHLNRKVQNYGFEALRVECALSASADGSSKGEDMPALEGKVIEALPATDLLKKRGSISEEDLVKKPLRNRVGLFEQRTAHAMFHASQLRFVTKP